MTTQSHEIRGFQEQSLSNSGYVWNDGYDCVICACGWKSAAVQRNKVALVAMHTAHAERAIRSAPSVAGREQEGT
jgi:hypothetical protein